MKYMRQLDGLRALAVFGVWMIHWGIQDLPGFDYVNWGLSGVMLFFILSGFLITGILLRAREAVDNGDCTLWTASKIFYIRRFLRIIPIYYLTLFVMAFLLPEVRTQFKWYATYTTNIHLALNIERAPVGGHFWSLASEEQFYIFWPWVVLLCPRRLKFVGPLGLLAVGIGVRFVLAVTHHHGAALGCIDQFGLGALLGMVSEKPSLAWAKILVMRIGKFIAMPVMIGLILYLHGRDYPILSVVALPVASAWFFAYVIARAGEGFKGPVGWFLECGPLVYLGRISYGLYIYHGFMLALWAKAGFAPIENAWLQTLTFGAISVVIATISWYSIEGPINSLKRFFQMPKPKRRAAAFNVDLGAATQLSPTDDRNLRAGLLQTGTVS